MGEGRDSAAHDTSEIRARGPRPYLSVRQLAEVTPWSQGAIRTMMSRRILVEGVHYFRPGGRGARAVFSWEAVQRFIEGRDEPESCAEGQAKIWMASGAVVRVDGE